MEITMSNLLCVYPLVSAWAITFKWRNAWRSYFTQHLRIHLGIFWLWSIWTSVKILRFVWAMEKLYEFLFGSKAAYESKVYPIVYQWYFGKVNVTKINSVKILTGYFLLLKLTKRSETNYTSWTSRPHGIYIFCLPCSDYVSSIDKALMLASWRFLFKNNEM